MHMEISTTVFYIMIVPIDLREIPTHGNDKCDWFSNDKGSLLKCFTDELQFGFQKNASTVQYILLLMDTVLYNTAL